MEYRPITAVWEITMGCNLRCKHCGSSCENPLAGELTTDEAVNLTKDLGKMGFQWITLSGGEPTTRNDWHIIAKSLSDNGIIPNMITNGWLFNKEIYDKAVAAKINTIAFSIDGLKNTHDKLRRPGSFDRIMESISLFDQNPRQLSVSAITTLNQENILELEDLLKIFEAKKVRGWQIQIGLPMGNMSANKNLIIEPSHIDRVIDFAYEAMNSTNVSIQLADCIGYYNLKEIQVRKKSFRATSYTWQGCNAGKYGLGILHNGDIIGCTSIRGKEYIEGNIKETPIKEIWENENSFKWNRALKKDQLKGFCAKCKYGSQCLGGCANTRVTMEKDIFGENKYCSYNHTISIANNQLADVADPAELFKKAHKFINNNNFQLAEICLANIIKKFASNSDGNFENKYPPNETPDLLTVLKLYGYAAFMLENYQDAKLANEKALKIDPNDAYANKGLGITLTRLDFIAEGIKYLENAIRLNKDPNFTDPYYDLALVYFENNNFTKAKQTLEAGFEINEGFKNDSAEFYDMILEEISNNDFTNE